ncbi:pyridoxine biosynthesis transcriptional regulator PdxR [Corynebacterium kutscheri]|uniref:Pyridoxine biosynthesis transcriptional regulator PdxR n=1 Tax=Corynebacterium kutscheri TaxID=35755 RepID=A0A0F6R190_9CORY|nr:PLP-dependent aminotransferase family protein [Corynebacterium kutscheri]AKE40863.1 transcriptional regulator with HTH domain and aminotransferase domain [Corynebacterium kutscheri]VEH06609.1 pyridoxine biosynthesis transcriptional regulator PdxR [Corynebacterium kutscheri]VEH09160.1 pyridoxine biosynthesis transcriptional regulator PdxR [Corynebacterium kutscheri]VEH82538.1 pyridoxine biosynthesis transcriptional regulator PdxR [Corynebacterium kutscheri]
MRPDLVAELPIVYFPESPLRIPAQICEQIRGLVTQGLLSPGDHLPSSRSLAAQLGVSRGSVVTAYDQLLAEGYIITAHGSGSQINPQLLSVTPGTTPISTIPENPKNTLISLSPGMPDITKIVDSSWRSAWREAATDPSTCPLLGDNQLRYEIAEHVRHMRGVLIDPAQVIITAGAREGLSLILTCLGRNTIVGLESPGYPGLRGIPYALGHKIIDIPTTRQGIDVDKLDPHIDVAVLTPSHQYPQGGSLSAQTRTQLAQWAARTNTWLVEDDFDSELRYTGQPLPSLATIAPERTILLGTFSTLLSPGLSCGFIIVPPLLLQQLSTHRQTLGQPVSAITQRALSYYLHQGALRRRTQRLRRIYRRRRDMVVSLLGSLENTTLLPISGGLHAVLLCNSQHVINYCAQAGFQLTALEDYWGGTNFKERVDGIVFGFGLHDDLTLTRALEAIRDAVTG